MECNKEEAVRAKELAEKKMQTKDFLGARKIALKAQQLYPDLENISQMITVCDVHCSAESKVYGNEMDWYGILKIEPTADEASIKKQYRKFALLLHPDKNQFAGATDAFKLIGEAQRVLLDRGKRMLHDSKCKASRPGPPNWAPQQASSYNSNVRKQPWVQNPSTTPFKSFNPQHQAPQRQTQPVFPSEQRQTFWTVCPFCTVRYQFYREVINKLLHCQNCKKSFNGYETRPEPTPPPVPQHKELPHQGAFKPTVQGNVDVKINKGGVEESKSSRKVNGKRKQQESESSESCSTRSSSDSEEDINMEENGDVEQNVGVYREYPRRSTRSKVNVSYDDHLSDDDDDDDFGSPSKKAKGSGSVQATEDPVLKHEALKVNKPDSEKENGEIRARKEGHNRSSEANVASSSSSSPLVEKDPEFYEYPDPEFHDFDEDRGQRCFAVGQIWAIYDTLDAMPRFYGCIRKVFSPGFKLRITWLEPDPDGEEEVKWIEEGLPVSCGKFKHGSSEITEDQPVFSHLVHWENGSKRDTYKIYPRNGETWALFKHWDIKWHSVPVSERKKYEYEFVEILSDCNEGVGVSVAYLGKVKGFSCLFCRKTNEDDMGSFQIPPSQLFRFSHRVPSFQLTGEERKGVPKGSFELDPASLPKNLEEIAVPENLKVEAANMHPEISFSEPVATSDGNVNKKTQLDPVHVSSDNSFDDADVFEIPDPEFYNFDGDKSPEKFQIGQIWALYSDEDGLPKYYARIMNIDIQPEFKLHITWLCNCPLPKNTVKWLDKKMLTCCGMFKLQKDGYGEYTETGPFSHQIKAEHTDKKGVYAIFPKKGEVWALYRNWNAGITRSTLMNCEYDMVEILEENDTEFKVLVLELVNGFKSVFKAQMKGRSAITVEIPRFGLLRFSHQIPAFRLTKERGGSLRGYWELDPAALPTSFFRSS